MHEETRDSTRNLVLEQRAQGCREGPAPLDTEDHYDLQSPHQREVMEGF